MSGRERRSNRNVYAHIFVQGRFFFGGDGGLHRARDGLGCGGLGRDGLGFNGGDCGGGGCGCCGETAGLFELSTYLFLFDVLHAVGYFYFFDQLTQPACVCVQGSEWVTYVRMCMGWGVIRTFLRASHDPCL